MAVLQMLKGETPRQQFELKNERTVIGRHPECDIVLELGAVSRQHAQIAREAADYYIEDLQSRNGTYVNGKKVEAPVRLKENDRIKVGDVLFTFHAEPVTPPVEPPAGPAPSTILSTLDASTSSHLRVEVKPETKLRAILEITRNLSQTLILDQVLPKILESLFKIFPQADNAYLVLKDPQTGRIVPKAVRHRSGRREANDIPSRTIVQQAMSSAQAILSADAVSDARFQTSQSIADFRIRSMICAPLVGQDGQALGVIQLDTQDARNQFQQEDLDVLLSVASIAAVGVENAKLHEAQVEQQRLDQELRVAKQVQESFLPTSAPDVPGYRFFHHYEAAREVGGDYFDYVRLPGQRLAVAVADVAGKGVPAALLMARISAEVRNCLLTEPNAGASLTTLDRELERTVHENRFITCVLAVLDLQSHELTLANAGHPPPLLCRRGEVSHVGAIQTGLPLGVAPEIVYGEASLSLEPGDLLLLFTDGVTEAKNPADELYGMERLSKTFAAGPCAVQAVGHRVLEDVRQFVAGRGLSDDLTLLCIGRTA